MSLLTKMKNIRNRLFPREGSYGVAHAGKWAVNFLMIGVIAGLGSILFQTLCETGSHYFMDMLAGYRPPAPASEHFLFTPTATVFNRWILFLLPAAGGLLSGWLVYTFAPEAEGHGTDAAIEAYHQKGGFIRSRVPFIKTIASALTLTTGGSGGREGPIAQIGAGFGSFLATRLKLSNRERRIMMAAGMGAGIGSIFRAPLAGALFAAEVLYQDPEFESEVILPSGIAAVVAYCVYCLFYGWGSLFHTPGFKFENPLELGPYLALALILVPFGALYVNCFYGVTRMFHSFNIPNHIKPVVGGLCTGAIGLYLPFTMSFGYGYAQKALDNELGITILLLLAVGKIITTSFSIGSGGSGGVFGPSVVIGGAVGGAVGQAFNILMPTVVTEPGAFVVVGMAGFFTAVSNTPISTMIFVSEMTDSYHLLLPSLLVCSVSYLASQRWTIYHRQVKGKIQSPAHAGEFFLDILETIHVRDLMGVVQKVQMIPQSMPFLQFKLFFSGTKQHYFPVMDDNKRLTGIFSSTDIREVLFSQEIEHLVVMKDICATDIIFTTPREDLNSVLQKFTVKNIDSLPVVNDEDHSTLIGMLSRREVIAFYNNRINDMKHQAA